MVPTVSVSESNGVFRLAVHGKLDTDAAATLKHLLAPYSESVTHDVELDLLDVTYVGSECVGVLWSFGSKIRTAGCVMKVSVGTGIVESVLTVCGFFRMYEKLSRS